MDDYECTVAAFSWEAARAPLDGLPAGGLYIAHEAVDRPRSRSRRRPVAVRHLGRRNGVRDITYGELAERTSRFANVLEGLGVGPATRC
jgi:acetyl-CoA synthetase